MVLPTRVNIINDTGVRFKVKIDNNRDRKFDEIVNINPGDRLNDIEGSVNFGYDVIVDIIINPEGPDNNIRFGGFRFNNPLMEPPTVESDEIFTLSRTFYAPNSSAGAHEYGYVLIGRAYGTGSYKRAYWAKLKRGTDKPNYYNFDEDNAKLINSAPKPTFTIEAFPDDPDAKVWDLRINSENFTL